MIASARSGNGLKAGYASAEWGISAAEFFVQVYLLEFYISHVGLDPLLAGIALALAVIWDAVSDPLMGQISDRTHSRWGRRLPWVLLGGIALGLTLVLLFSPPDWDNQAWLFLYLLGSYLMLNTAMTVFSVPHLSLAAELSDDANERTAFFGWRLGFGIVGLTTGMLLPGLLGGIVEEKNALASRTDAAWVVAGLIVVTCVLSVFACRGKDTSKPANDSLSVKQFFSGIGAVMRDVPFRFLLIAFTLAAVGRTINSSLALIYYKLHLQLPEETVVQQILGLFVVLMLLAIPFWVWLGKRYGKRNPGIAGVAVLGAMTCVAYPLFPPGQVAPPLIAAVVGGIAVSSVLLLESLVADIARNTSDDSIRHNEGLYFGLWKFAQKLARAVGLLLTGAMLGWLGVSQETEAAPDDGSIGIALLFGPGVGIFFLLAAYALYRIPSDTNQR